MPTLCGSVSQFGLLGGRINLADFPEHGDKPSDSIKALISANSIAINFPRKTLNYRFGIHEDEEEDNSLWAEL
jgi:hypothetical protein